MHTTKLTPQGSLLSGHPVYYTFSSRNEWSWSEGARDRKAIECSKSSVSFSIKEFRDHGNVENPDVPTRPRRVKQQTVCSSDFANSNRLTNSFDLLSDWQERVWALSVRNRLLETKSQNWHLKSCPSLLLCVVNLRVFNAMGTAFFSTPIFKGLAGLLLLTAVFVVLASTTSRTFSVPAPPPLPPERQFSGTGSPTSTFGLARGSFPDSWLGVPPRPYPPDGVM